MGQKKAHPDASIIAAHTFRPDPDPDPDSYRDYRDRDRTEKKLF